MKNSLIECNCKKSILQTVIIGSFRKHLPQILLLKDRLETINISVLSPNGDSVVDSEAEFIIFHSDPTNDPKILQDAVFAKIRQSGFIIVANVDGYIGRAAILEIGYAIAIGLSIYSLEPVNDPHLSPYCRLLSEIFPNINGSMLDKSNKIRDKFMEYSTTSI